MMDSTRSSSELSSFLTYRLVGGCYGLGIICSIGWLWFRGRLQELNQFGNEPLKAFGLGFGFAFVVIIFTWFLLKRSSRFRLFMGYFKVILGPISFSMAFFAALMSSIAEELFFRGTLQPVWGLFWASVFFGLCHFPMTRYLIPWTFFAFVVGVGLGWLFDVTQNLLAPVSAHFWINFINFQIIQRFQPSSEELEQLQKMLLLPSIPNS